MAFLPEKLSPKTRWCWLHVFVTGNGVLRSDVMLACARIHGEASFFDSLLGKIKYNENNGYTATYSLGKSKVG